MKYSRQDLLPLQQRLTAGDVDGTRVRKDTCTDAVTMIGMQRLENISVLAGEVARNNVPGDFMECGVWRGGATIFMRACLDAYGLDDRKIFVADSFEGCPVPNPRAFPADAQDPHSTFGFLKVPLSEVLANFETYGFADDDRVEFLAGWFKYTLPGTVERLALLRLDSDMYESTTQALEALYPKLSIGGYLVLDDYQNIPQCHQAIEDFRQRHGITETMQPVDWCAVYWKKEREFTKAPLAIVGKGGGFSESRRNDNSPLFSICHTSARPEKWREIYDAWIKAAVHPEQVEYVLCVDERWGFHKPSVVLQLEAWMDERECLNEFYWNEGRRCYVDGVNTAAKASTGRILIVNADDQWPCEGWDQELIAQTPVTSLPTTVRTEAERNEFVIEVSTGTPDEHSRGILVMPILSRARYEAQGSEVFYHEYESMYADNDFCEHARQDGVVIDARHLMFPHKHPLFDVSVRKPGVPWNETDEAYKAQNDRAVFESGCRIMERRRFSGFSDTVRITNLMEDPRPQRTIALCLTGENFRGEWLDGFLNLYDHLIRLNFGIYRLREYNSNVYVTREQARQMIVSLDPPPDLVLWLDDDNICSPEHFNLLLEDLERNPEFDGVTGWAWIYDDDLKRFMVSCGTWAPDRLRWQPFDALSFPHEKEVCSVEASGFPCFLMRMSAFEKAGPRPFLPVLDERLTHGILGEDFAFLLKAEANGGKFLADPRVRVPHLKYRDANPAFTSLAGSQPDPKIVVMMRVKNEARWIDRTISAAKSLGPVYVMDDGSEDGTYRIASDAGALVYTSPFLGSPLDERRDKNWLLDLIVQEENPDWILCIDGDEELEPHGPEKIRAVLRNAQAECYCLRFCHLWDKPDQVRIDRWFKTFARPSLFRPTPGVRFRCRYEDSGYEVYQGFHTGNAPSRAEGLNNVPALNVYLLHYGYMLKEDRIRKWQWYNQIDPHNVIEDFYRHAVQGDVPEVPKEAVLKYAGPLELATLPESMLRRPLVNVTPEVASSAAD